MPVPFPTNPSNNDSFTFGVRSWVYNSSKNAWQSSNMSNLNFGIVSVSGQNNIVAETQTDTLTFATGSGISITTNTGTDTITISKNETVNSISTSQAVLRDTVNLVSTSTGNRTITLPSTSPSSRVTVKKITSDANKITILPLSGTIDNDTFAEILFYNSAMTVVSSGSNWFII